MQSEVVEFLQTQRVSVVGILQIDNAIHSAALHYSFVNDPIRFYFMTQKKSRKCRSLLTGEKVNASVVIGFSEEEFKTFQAEGTIRIVSNEQEFADGWESYGTKYPNRTGQKINEEMVLLEFQPDYWWRYQDLNATPKVEFSSESIG
jgi:uncharacterized protein YhbP (UPF0306 family)